MLLSISASCYASIHTGVGPQVHGCTGNGNVFRLGQPDIFGQVRAAGGVTGAVAHSFWSQFFNRHPFDFVRDIEYDEADSATINHGRFHSMTGYGHDNQMTPCDLVLFATLTSRCHRFGLTYGLLHSCTLDSMGHRFFHDCQQMDHACLAAGASRVLRMEGPSRVRRYVLWIGRSRIASANVGSSTMSCQASTGG